MVNANNGNGKMSKILLLIGGSIAISSLVAFTLYQVSEAHCAEIEREIEYRHDDLIYHIQLNRDILRQVRDDIRLLEEKIPNED